MSEKIACGSCGGKNPKHQCPYCKCASYCNEQCAMVGWNAHQDECNVIHVSSPTATAFVPYFGEESFDERQLEDVDPQGALHQTYIVHYTDPAGAIVQHTVEPILSTIAFSQKIAIERSGANPNNVQWGVGKERGIQDIPYTMTISYTSEIGDRKDVYIPGLFIGPTAIYKDTKDPIRKKLANLPGRKAFTIRDNEVLLLWPGMDLIRKTMRESGWDISSNGGILRIALSLPDNKGQQREFSSVEGVLCFGFQTGEKGSVFLRGTKRASPFKTELEIKNSQKRADIPFESIFALRGDNPKDGSGVVVTFQLQRDRGGKAVESIQLIDIEYRAPINPLVKMRLIILKEIGQRQQQGKQPPTVTPEQEKQLTELDVLKGFEDTTEADAQVHNSIPFHLDADNLDHVSGLLMAMEQQMDERHYEDLAIIQEHQKKLEHSKLTGEEYSTPPAVQAVVYDVSNQMFKQINGVLSEWKGKRAEKRDNPSQWSFERMRAYVRALPRPESSKFNPFRTGKSKALLRMVEKELDKRINKLKAQPSRSPDQEAEFTSYKEYLDTIVDALFKFDSSGK
jgi:hypothetical protein